MIEGRHWLSLDAHRYIEVVGVHGDGRSPYAHFRGFVVEVQGPF